MSEKKALIVIDMQNDYLWEKKKPMFTYDTDKLVSDVNRTIETCSAQGCDVIYIKHVLPKLMWGVGFSIKGTEGSELYPGLNVVSDLIFEKNRSDSYTSKAFRTHMRREGYTEVFLCGLDECGCVGATAKGAAKTGIKVHMIEESIGRRFPEDKIRKMRSDLKALGVEYI